ncbi:MAG: helix-turn-helix transcriptional regulator [Bradyrhizobium sp.]
MPAADDVFAAIEAIYSAGLDETLWPKALGALTECVGGVGATLETYSSDMALDEFRSFAIPPGSELKYLADYLQINPRLSHLRYMKPGSLVWDYMLRDERTMDRDPFYADFLMPMEYRYCIGAALAGAGPQRSFVSVQRVIKQGHVARPEIEMMQRLWPHVGQALDMTRRLNSADRVRRSFEEALDRLADGVGLLRADGTLLFANEALQAIGRANDGIRLRKNVIAFANAAVQTRFDSALASLRKLHDRDSAGAPADFHAERPSASPSYFVSVRPLAAERGGRSDAAAEAIVFVRDPLVENIPAVRVLRAAFGLTQAEADLARALQSGGSMSEYAQSRLVSITTIYAHLRSIKQKTGCSRMAELIHKLNGVYVPLR